LGLKWCAFGKRRGFSTGASKTRGVGLPNNPFMTLFPTFPEIGHVDFVLTSRRLVGKFTNYQKPKTINLSPLEHKESPQGWTSRIWGYPGHHRWARRGVKPLPYRITLPIKPKLLLTPKESLCRSPNNRPSSTYGGSHLLTDKFPPQDWGFFFEPIFRFYSFSSLFRLASLVEQWRKKVHLNGICFRSHSTLSFPITFWVFSNQFFHTLWILTIWRDRTSETSDMIQHIYI